MLIGQDRSGKTSLKKSLKGMPFNPNEGSTVGIDVDPSYFKVTTETWKIGEEDQATDKDAKSYFEYNLGREVLKNLRTDENVPQTDTEAPSASQRNEVTEDPPAGILGQDASSMHSLARTLSETDKDDNHAVETTGNYKSYLEQTTATQTTERDDPLSPKKTLRDIESLLPDLLAVDDMKSDDIFSVFWDFAGESVYYETHTLFLTSRAIFLLTYDLSRNPYERALPVKRQGMFKLTEDRTGSRTNLDYLDYWMTSVSSVSSKSKDHEVRTTSTSTLPPETVPPVFLVCTHADQPSDGKDPGVLAREVYGELQEKSYSTHLCGKFEVDNTKSGKKPECPGVSSLRESIRAVAKELPQFKEYIPIKWLKFEKVLQVFLNNGHKWITIELAKQIASDFCHIHDDVAFKTAIDFLHDQRILLHFDNPDELNKLVVLDLQWLIDVMKEVITIKRYDDGEREFKFLWRQLQKEGILEEKLLQHVWDPLIGKHDTFKGLIAIMEKFSLLCSWPASDDLSSKRYLVPSMLNSRPPRQVTQLIACARLPSLFIKFESGQVPLRLFPRLVTQFLLWGKDGFWSSVKPQLYQNFVRLFTAKDGDCSVVLLCHSSFIEVVVHGGNASFDVSCAQSVFKQLFLMLECMRKEFFWLESMIYKAGVVCTVCCRERKVKYCDTHCKDNCEREECLHFISESELRSASKPISCTRSPTEESIKVCIENFSVWFGSCEKVSSFANTSGPPLQEGRKLKVTLLSNKWRSNKGGLSTIIRELAIQLAKCDDVEVCVYLPRFSIEDKKEAADCRVRLLKAKERAAYDPIDWLAFIPIEHQMDVVIGHGIHLGRQISFIKEAHQESKWMHVVHTDHEELGMVKLSYADSTVEGEKEYEAELKLCEDADQVVAIGPKLASTYSRSCGQRQVFVLTPGIFSEFSDIEQDTDERKEFRVLVFGRGDSEDFQVNGYDIAARAVANLKDAEHPFKLVFVGAPIGKEERIKEMLLKEGISHSQLIVRSAKERKQLAQQFYEADLFIMPSRTEGFGLTALEALSAGLPVLVSYNSGFGQALKEVPNGKNVVLNSDDPTEWAKEIKAVQRSRRGLRLEEASGLREKYAKMYQWEEQCRKLVEKMHDIVKT
ncbi:uncharacterized protein LOC122955367 isoform X2 [Acropora millepora]|uniref:uncharacterized protein LOC122955367 isoform X2 n=1 Tax=Acropora millepora TaxID=45264 RepID=UPI001CF39E49|nr:uncharacterized protein LOC122955367 isoform X2 [Acropora millepora]